MKLDNIILNKEAREGLIVYDSICMKYPVQVNP